MPKPPPPNKALSEIEKLERTFNRLQAAERRKLKNEDILYLEKNGDIGYERIRTIAVNERDSVREGEAPAEPSRKADDQIPANSNLLPNTLPETPETQENGNLFGENLSPPTSPIAAAAAAQIEVAQTLAATDSPSIPTEQPAPPAPISCHDPQKPGNLKSPQERDPLAELLHRAIAVAQTRRGRPAAFDDHSKGQLVALLSVGMSMRQAAAVLGVSHTTVQKTLKADPALEGEISAARFQAQLQPLACVIREARRSWKAATWLLKYLDSKIASHEETPDERRERQQREADEFFGRAPAPGVKKRRLQA